MSIPRSHALAEIFLLVAAAASLALSPLAQARGIGIEPVPSTPLEVPPLLATAQDSSAPWSPSESGPLAGKASKGKAPTSRAGKAFTPSGKKEIDAANASKHDGINKCENCGTGVVPGQKSQLGVSPPLNQRERDHIIPKSRGGDGTPSNGQVLCRECNLEKSDKVP